MKPLHVIYAFGAVALAALSLQLVSTFWLPLVLGAGAVVAILLVTRR
jgi:predicted RND superfamily exporter protein